MNWEFAPPPPKIRVTKKQLREIQENYKKAWIKSKKFDKIEKLEKEILEEQIDEQIDEVF